MTSRSSGLTPGRRLLDYAVAGLVGQALVASGRRLVAGRRGRAMLVGAVAQGIAVGRRLEAAAEETRLRAGDLVAEARERLGEEATPPTEPSTAVHDHGHAH